MFSLFPNQWELPVPRNFKPIKNLADHHFYPKTLRISKPVPEPIKIERPKQVVANPDFEIAKSFMPIEELCLNEPPLDTTDIDKLLEQVFNPSPESKAQQILNMTSTINESLRKNISLLKSSSGVEVDAVSKKDLLKLFEGFLNYSLNLENYFKSINQVKTI